MVSIPDDLRQRLRLHGQDHVLAWWDRLDEGRQRELLGQLQALDLDQLRRLYEQRGKAQVVPAPERIQPVPYIAHDAPDRADRQRIGEDALRSGQVAALLVAGG